MGEGARFLLAQTPTIRLDFAVLGPTIPPLLARDAGIAQLVEHDLAKVGVASSSLVSRSKFKWLCKQVQSLATHVTRAGSAADSGWSTSSWPADFRHPHLELLVAPEVHYARVAPYRQRQLRRVLFWRGVPPVEFLYKPP